MHILGRGRARHHLNQIWFAYKRRKPYFDVNRISEISGRNLHANHDDHFRFSRLLNRAVFQNKDKYKTAKKDKEQN